MPPVEQQRDEVLPGIAVDDPADEARRALWPQDLFGDPLVRPSVLDGYLSDRDGRGHLLPSPVGCTWQRQNTAERPRRRVVRSSPVSGSVSVRE